MERLSPQQIIDSFKEVLGSGFITATIYQREVAVAKNRFRSLWITITRESFLDAVRHVVSLEPHPHLAMITGRDTGADIEMLYHFTIYFGRHLEELNLALRLSLPKNDPVIPTVTGFIPGAIFSEREIQEMMGVRVDGIPDNRRLLLEGVLPEGVYPWRKDDAELQKYLRVLPGRNPACSVDKEESHDL